MKISNLFNLIAHEVVPRKCIDHMESAGYVVRCSRCGEPIAICYHFDDELRVSVLPRFRRYKEQIENKLRKGNDLSSGKQNDAVYECGTWKCEGVGD